MEKQVVHVISLVIKDILHVEKLKGIFLEAQNIPMTKIKFWPTPTFNQMWMNLLKYANTQLNIRNGIVVNP